MKSSAALASQLNPMLLLLGSSTCENLNLVTHFYHLSLNLPFQLDRLSLTHGSNRTMPPMLGGEFFDLTYPALRLPSGKTLPSLEQPFIPFENSQCEARIKKRMLRMGVS